MLWIIGGPRMHIKGDIPDDNSFSFCAEVGNGIADTFCGVWVWGNPTPSVVTA